MNYKVLISYYTYQNYKSFKSWLNDPDTQLDYGSFIFNKNPKVRDYFVSISIDKPITSYDHDNVDCVQDDGARYRLFSFHSKEHYVLFLLHNVLDESVS